MGSLTLGTLMLALADNLQVLSLVPGRMRLHIRGWTGESEEHIENGLSRIDGVQSVQANPLTRNILVRFDHRATDADALLAKLNAVLGELSNDERPTDSGRSLLRVGVRGLLGHAVVDSLWLGAGFLGSAMGLPLAGLGPLHVLMDITVWTMALAGEHHIHHPLTSSVSRDAQRSADALPFGSRLTSYRAGQR